VAETQLLTISLNDAVLGFKRYEDASLEYTGINKHQEEKIGLFDISIESKKLRIFTNQREL